MFILPGRGDKGLLYRQGKADGKNRDICVAGRTYLQWKRCEGISGLPGRSRSVVRRLTIRGVVRSSKELKNGC
jgi:hypothetical protein